jgi:hypothetical protein
LKGFAVDGLVLEVFERIVRAEDLTVEELEGIAIGFDTDVS